MTKPTTFSRKACGSSPSPLRVPIRHAQPIAAGAVDASDPALASAGAASMRAAAPSRRGGHASASGRLESVPASSLTAASRSRTASSPASCAGSPASPQPSIATDAHRIASQTSRVQGSPSSHEVESMQQPSIAMWMQRPSSVHASKVHGSESSHSRGTAPTHTPERQNALGVQASPSSHGVPSLKTASAGQVGAPAQRSSGSQIPRLGRQIVPTGSRTSSGHVGSMPLQVSRDRRGLAPSGRPCPAARGDRVGTRC